MNDKPTERDTTSKDAPQSAEADQSVNQQPSSQNSEASPGLEDSQAASPDTIPGTITEDRVLEELKHVIDPELFVNIVDLGLIYVVNLKPRDDGQSDVSIDMTMTSPACPAGPQLIANSKQVVSRLDGIGDVEVQIVMDPPWTPDRMSEDARDQLGIF